MTQAGYIVLAVAAIFVVVFVADIVRNLRKIALLKAEVADLKRQLLPHFYWDEDGESPYYDPAEYAELADIDNGKATAFDMRPGIELPRQWFSARRVPNGKNSTKLICLPHESREDAEAFAREVNDD